MNFYCFLRELRRVEPETFGSEYGFSLVLPPAPEPVVEIHVLDRWRAESESEAEARDRLSALCGQQIEAEMARIRAEYKGAGFVFGYQRNREKVRQRLYWLYRRLAHGERFAAIAAEAQLGGADVSEKTIRNETAILAKKIGLSL